MYTLGTDNIENIILNFQPFLAVGENILVIEHTTRKEFSLVIG